MIYILCLLLIALFLVIVYLRFPGIIIELIKRYSRWKTGVARYEVQVEDHRWVYLAGGEGEVIVLVHGFGGDKDRWGPFLARFDYTRYRMVVPDLPGFGENSRLTSASYDIPRQADRLHRFMQAINVTSFHLAGVSMGGCIAGYYASEHPDQVKSLTLMSSAGVRGTEPSDMARYQQETKRNILIVNAPGQFAELNTFMYHTLPRIPGTFTRYFAGQAIAESGFHGKVYGDLQKTGDSLLESRLGDIVCPTLVIWGAQDRVFHVSSVNVLERGIKHCQTAIIEQCGHVPYLEKPEETKAAYCRFLEGITGAGGASKPKGS